MIEYIKDFNLQFTYKSFKLLSSPTFLYSEVKLSQITVHPTYSEIAQFLQDELFPKAQAELRSIKKWGGGGNKERKRKNNVKICILDSFPGFFRKENLSKFLIS